MIQVLARLSGSKRYRAGRIVALIYLLCVLAPSFAFAFGNARLSEHCLFDDGPVAGLTYQSDAALSATGANSPTHQQASDDVDAMHHHHGSMLMADEPTPTAPHHSHHTAFDQQCCGTPCIAAMPVVMTEVAIPRSPHTFLVPETGRHLAASVPALLYRPPIS